jgi:hypothetical protein
VSPGFWGLLPAKRTGDVGSSEVSDEWRSCMKVVAIPTITQLIYFKIFKAISEWNREEGVADHGFYKDKTDYYCEANIKFLRNKIAGWIAGREIKKTIKDR